MAIKLTDLDDYKTDYLFLLVGSNPLPNYVAALLLVKKDGIVYLLHSGGDHGTSEVADRLKTAIKNRKKELDNVFCREVDESKGHIIFHRMDEVLGKIDRKVSMGLNYTGGTKAMAVHVYRAIEKKGFSFSVFSYLDARTLSLVIDGKNEPIILNPLEMDCSLSLSELLSLHGYNAPIIRKKLLQPDFCRVLAKTISQEGAWKKWNDWIKNEKNFYDLPDTAQYPELKDILDAFDKMCNQKATPNLVATCLGYNCLTQCSKWLIGSWLEEYVLSCFIQIAKECNINDYGVDLEPRRQGVDKFNLDVAAIKGYHLFAISCIISDKKDKCKEHLLEVYVRARQIGGDEARVGLVCCSSDPLALQKEINETWFGEGRIKVFGRKDLADLPSHLTKWFQTAND
jgi:hypothetical protein